MFDPEKKQRLLLWLEKLLRIHLSAEIMIDFDNHDQFVLSIDKSESRIYIPCISVLWQLGYQKLSCTKWDASKEGFVLPLRKALPAPGISEITAQIIEKKAQSYTIHYDILGVAFWMMTRAEEIGREDLDSHDRFPASASHAFKNGYLERPIVDEWFCILRQVASLLWPQLELTKQHFSMKVSHDVDLLSRYRFRPCKKLLGTMAIDLFKKGNFFALIKAPLIRIAGRNELSSLDECNTYDWLMDISEENGLKSAFYFFCGKTHPRKDADYNPEHPLIRKLMRHIYDRGHEIGIHPSYNTYQTPELIAAEANKLRSICGQEGIKQSQWGGRMHCLRWRNPITLYGFELANLNYDNTLGYADSIGFRCGTCHEYPAFDPVKYQILSLNIRPLIAAEFTALSDEYMGLGLEDQIRKKFKELKDVCRAVNGCFTLLWHNSNFLNSKDFVLYKDIVGS